MSAAAAGALTSIPVLCFGVGALAAPATGRRLGVEAALVAALATICLGTLVRAAGGETLLFLGTVVAGGGIAVGNVVVPAIIRGRLPRHVGPLMGAYTSLLGVGAAVAGGLAVPLARAVGWRGSLAAWAAPAALAIAVGGVALVRDRGPEIGLRGGAGRTATLLRSGLAWSVLFFFGLQSALFYSGLSWLPSILHGRGMGHTEAGVLLAVYAVVGVPASISAPIVAARVADQRLLLVGFAAVELLGVAGLLAFTRGSVVWVVVWAIGQGGSFALSLTIVVLRSPSARRAAELSAMAQAGGYALAALGPLLVGVLHDVTGGWSAALAFLLALGAPTLWAGLVAGRARFVPE